MPVETYFCTCFFRDRSWRNSLIKGLNAREMEDRQDGANKIIMFKVPERFYSTITRRYASSFYGADNAQTITRPLGRKIETETVVYLHYPDGTNNYHNTPGF